MRAIKFLTAHIPWSRIPAFTFVVFVVSLMTAATASPPEPASTLLTEAPAATPQDVRLKANLQNRDTVVGPSPGGQTQDTAVGPPSGGQTQHDANSKPLRFGLAPYLSPSALVKAHQPLLEYLERSLQRPIIVLTAPDFKSFLERAGQGRYDFYFTAPHFAALAESRYRHRRLCRWSGELYGLVLVAKDSTYQRIEDLRGKIVAEPGELAGIALLGDLLLVDHGLQPGKDVTIRNTTHNNALLSATEGYVDATITAIMVYQSLDDKSKNQYRTIAQTQHMPAPMFMAGSTLPEAEYQAAKSALLAFSADVPASSAYFKLTGIQDLVPITDNDMERLAPLLSALEAGLGQ